MLNKLLKNLLIFLLFFLVLNTAFSFFNKKDGIIDNNVTISTTKDEYAVRKTVTVEITNGTGLPIVFANNCPNQPLRVYKKENNKWIEISAITSAACNTEATFRVEPGKDLRLAYDKWHYSLFSSLGRYRIDLETKIGEEEVTISSNEFVVTENGLFWKTVLTVFYKPIYNALIYLTSVMPGHNLGLAIILLTILIRTILLYPSQKALKSQQKMQKIQPRLNEIKEKYKGDQQRISMETMAIWKEAKVNPAGSCLPMILQLPFLISLYYSVRDVINPDATYYLYSALADFNLADINVIFLNILDLTKPNVYVLPLIIGGLQFIQIKLTMAKKASPKKENEFAKAQSMTMYAMPVMIAVFTATLPAGIGVYWGTSTLYGIFQQVFVNKDSTKSKSSVKVINN